MARQLATSRPLGDSDGSRIEVAWGVVDPGVNGLFNDVGTIY